MGVLNTKEPRKFLEKLRNQNTVKIFSSDELHSICALHVLICIFKKELIKYEVNIISEYKEDIADLKIMIDLPCENLINALCFGSSIENENVDLVQSDFVDCACHSKEINSCYTLYDIARKLNYLNNEILWPLLILYDFNRNLSLKGGTLGWCDKCNDIFNDLLLELKKFNSEDNIDKILIEEQTNLLFCHQTSLYESLTMDLTFIAENKLYIKKENRISNNYYKINEYLAKLGISTMEAKENYANLNLKTRSFIHNSFKKETVFIKQVGYDLKVSTLEHFFILNYYLSIGLPFDCLLSFQKRSYLNTEEGSKFYSAIINCLKSTFLRMKQFRGIRILFLSNKKELDVFKYKVDVFFKNFYDITQLFIRKLKKEEQKMLIVIENFENGKSFLFSKGDWLLNNLLEINCEFETIKNCSFLIKRSDLRYVLDNLLI